jgi:hypothetical protein
LIILSAFTRTREAAPIPASSDVGRADHPSSIVRPESANTNPLKREMALADVDISFWRN